MARKNNKKPRREVLPRIKKEIFLLEKRILRYAPFDNWGWAPEYPFFSNKKENSP